MPQFPATDVPSSCRSPSRFLSGDRSPSSGERRPGNRLSGDQSRWCSRSAGRRRVTSVVYMVRKRPTFAGILRIFTDRWVRKLAGCFASFLRQPLAIPPGSLPPALKSKPGDRESGWLSADRPRYLLARIPNVRVHWRGGCLSSQPRTVPFACLPSPRLPSRPIAALAVAFHRYGSRQDLPERFATTGASDQRFTSDRSDPRPTEAP